MPTYRLYPGLSKRFCLKALRRCINLFVLVCSYIFGCTHLTAGEQIRFNSDIRPILSEKCFFCHGPDENTRGAGLRLDDRDSAIQSGAIVVGDPAASQLMVRVHDDAPESRMPPPESKLMQLTDSEKRILHQWIEQGAEYEKHWAFEPLKMERLKTENVSDTIDALVRDKLQKHGLVQSPKADKYTLARRAAFDVTGLPPSDELLDAFISDENDDAISWEAYLDRLLASPQYGERMAVDWLDVARYADSFGFQVDRDIEVWPWRDWVIDAFNDNKRFDEFIVEQIAGDMLPNATQDQILATTFNRLHQQESEGGSVEEEYRVEYVSDRLHTYGTAFLGLTLECARCHDHKFDPISQKEYYQLFAFFQNIDEAGLYSYFTSSQPTPTLAFRSADQEVKLRQLRDEVSELENNYAAKLKSALNLIDDRSETNTNYALTPAGVEPRASILQLKFDLLESGKTPDSIKPDSFASVEGDNKLVPGIFDSAVEFTGDDPVKTNTGNFKRNEPFSISLWLKTPDRKERAVVFHRSQAWTDAGSRGYELLIEDGKLKWSLIHFWPGNAISIRAISDLKLDQWTHVSVTYDGSSYARGLAIYVDGQPIETETVKDKLTKEITGGGNDHITLGERFRDRGFTKGLIDELHVFDFELSHWEVTYLSQSQTVENSTKAATIETTTNTNADRLEGNAFSANTKEIFKKHVVLTGEPSLIELRKQLLEARRKLHELEDSLVEIMVMQELPQPKPAFILNRGEYANRGETVYPDTPQVLPSLPVNLPKNRLTLAQWTVSPSNPLTSRVIVNRFWQSIFGYGLVKTAEDFGSQGSRPENPELLDALAANFIANDWNTKQLIKAILMSDTYQQSSSFTAEQQESDPDNTLLARGPRFRLPAEMIRDSVLSSSQLLNMTVGGPSVSTYELTESFKPSTLEDNSDRYRRSIYTRWRRTGPPPALLAFDAPRRAVCTPKRERTNTPLQSLILLNNPQNVEASIHLADQLVTQFGQDNSSIVKQAFKVCLGRPATENEVTIAMELLEEQSTIFAESPNQLQDLVGSFRSKPVNVEKDGFAAVVMLCHTLFNHEGAVVKR